MAPPWSRRFPLSSSGAAERRSVRACLDYICFLSVFSLDPIANLLFVSRKVRQGRKAVRASCKTYLFISRKVRQVRKVILKIKLRVLCGLVVRFIHGVCCLGNAGTIDNRTRHWRMLCGGRHDPHNATRIITHQILMGAETRCRARRGRACGNWKGCWKDARTRSRTYSTGRTRRWTVLSANGIHIADNAFHAMRGEPCHAWMAASHTANLGTNGWPHRTRRTLIRSRIGAVQEQISTCSEPDAETEAAILEIVTGRREIAYRHADGRSTVADLQEPRPPRSLRRARQEPQRGRRTENRLFR